MERLSEEQMWEIIDGLASPEIIQKHNQLLLTDSAYKAEFEQIALLDEQLFQLNLESPSMRFTENVIDKVLDIKKQDYKKDWTPVIYLGVMGVFSIFFIKALAKSDTSSNGNSVINTDALLNALGSPFLLYSFILLNIIALLILIDRKVLQPFLNKKLK